MQVTKPTGPAKQKGRPRRDGGVGKEKDDAGPSGTKPVDDARPSDTKRKAKACGKKGG